jgi:hypothetical protein
MDDGGSSRLRPFVPAEPVPATGDEPPAEASQPHRDRPILERVIRGLQAFG